MTSANLDFVSSSTITCSVHPMVVVSVLDHYGRRNTGDKRVIGTLLGVLEEGSIHIRSSFPVPLQEEPELAVDTEFHQQMFELHSRSNPEEIIVGWYSTGDSIPSSSSLIHTFYGREMQRPPVHLLVSTVDQQQGKSQPLLRAYMGRNITLHKTSLGFRFRPILVNLDEEAVKSVSIRALIASVKESNSTKEDSPVAEVSRVEEDIARVRSVIGDLRQYVADVVSGKAKGNAEVGRALSLVVNRVPAFKPEAFATMVKESMQDVLMLVYLANLTKHELAVAEDLHCILSSGSSTDA